MEPPPVHTRGKSNPTPLGRLDNGHKVVPHFDVLAHAISPLPQRRAPSAVAGCLDLQGRTLGLADVAAVLAGLRRQSSRAGCQCQPVLPSQPPAAHHRNPKPCRAASGISIPIEMLLSRLCKTLQPQHWQHQQGSVAQVPDLLQPSTMVTAVWQLLVLSPSVTPSPDSTRGHTQPPEIRQAARKHQQQ